MEVTGDAPTETNQVALWRFNRGMTAIRPSRPQYGWEWRCPCGEHERVNGTKRECIGCALDHIADAHGLPRRKRFIEGH